MTAFEDRKRILIVDDEEPIRKLLTQYLRNQGFEVSTASDGREALERLAMSRFDLVLSDVRMPEMDGIALLSEIMRQHGEVGVLMLTGCEDVSMAVAAMKTGALDYVLKPFQLENVGQSVRNALARQNDKLREAGRLRDLERLVEHQTIELRHTLASLHDASNATLEALVAALDARERETQAHSKRVSEYTVYLASAMGVQGPTLEVFRRGALLHDIGKIGISDIILLKPGELTDSEWEEMRKHPLIGYWILRGIDFLRPSAEIVLAHHERFDGLGYPRNLKGEEIPLGARIFAVVDALDAITSDRPYHKGQPYEEARAEILQNSGTQFDPHVVRRFMLVPQETWAAIRRSTHEQETPAMPEIAPLVLS